MAPASEIIVLLHIQQLNDTGVVSAGEAIHVLLHHAVRKRYSSSGTRVASDVTGVQQGNEQGKMKIVKALSMFSSIDHARTHPLSPARRGTIGRRRRSAGGGGRLAVAYPGC